MQQSAIIILQVLHVYNHNTLERRELIVLVWLGL